MLRAILFSFFIAFSSLIYAQEDISVSLDGYEVFYSAFNASFISPEVASAAGIVRGKNKGLVNISVVTYDETGERHPVELDTIEGEAYDLIYRNPLEFKEVVEIGARYYLAPFKISADDEFIQFDIIVTPQNYGGVIPVKFKRRFFKD